MKKRTISIILVFAIIIAIIPSNSITVSAASDDLIWPCESTYTVTCMYYYKDGTKHSTRYGYQKSLDIAGGGNIVAAAAGTVETATNLGDSSFGKYVVIKHASGYRTLYGHLSSYSVSVGQTVSKGQKIGVMGSTGNSSGTHLHFEYSGGDPWKNYYNSKYASDIIFEQNVRSNNSSYNSDKTIVNVIDSNYYKSGAYYYYSGSHITHSYSGSYYEAVHPHRVYQMCSCGATKYVEGEYKTVSSCASCSMTVDSKYNTVKGFKAYPCVSSDFTCYNSDLTTSPGKIYTTDYCTIQEIYTNGWCKVRCPWSDGSTKTVYTNISNFVKTPSTTMGTFTAKTYINLYTTASMGTQIFRVYPGDVCYTIGTSGSATQIFMPHSDGYYVLGWIQSSEISSSNTNQINSKFPTPFKCRILSTTKVPAATSVNGVRDTNAGLNVYVDDDCVIREVYTNGWCKFDCPWSDGTTKTLYLPLSEFINVNIDVYAFTAPQYADTYWKSDKANTVGWIDAGDKITVVSTSGSMSQIIYPADVGQRCAWVESSKLVATYTVSYNANGGTGAPSSQTKTNGVGLTLSSTKPSRTGYTFVGWATSSSATNAQYTAGSIYTTEASVTLYAVWKKQSYTITYNANGGVNVPNAQTQTYETAVTVTNDTPKKFYTVTFNPNGGTVEPSNYSLECSFDSWNTSATGTGTAISSGSSYKPNANVTLYATYTNPTLAGYPIPIKEGYTFNGWYTAANEGTVVDSSTTITADTTLYAHWSLETYSVLYYDDGSSNLPTEQTKTHGTPLTLSSTVPVKDGYTFKGWATEEGSSTVVYSPGSQYTVDAWAVLYAVWEKNAATLSNIAIENMPTKIIYQIGDTLDTTGLILKLTYNDETTQSVTTGFTTSGFSSATAGTKTVTISYGDKTTSFTITVKEANTTEAKYEITNAFGTAGSTVDVYVSIANNPGIISLRNTVSYDDTALELISVQNCELLQGYATPSATITSPYTLRWADSLATVNNTSNGELVKLTFKIKENTVAGSYSISVNPVEARQTDGTKVTFSGADATVNVIEYIIGDTDGDGEISDWDAIVLNRYLAGWNVEIELNACDVDGDGDVSDWDAIILERYLAGWDVELEG